LGVIGGEGGTHALDVLEVLGALEEDEATHGGQGEGDALARLARLLALDEPLNDACGKERGGRRGSAATSEVE